MNKEQLLWEFLENKVVISKIKKDYKRIIDYYDKYHWYWFEGAKIVYDFINENLFQLTHDSMLNFIWIKEWIVDIKDYEISDYVFSLIDKHDEIIFESYPYFQKYINEPDNDYDNLRVLKEAQYDWFIELFLRIEKDFILFLENKIEEKLRVVRKLQFSISNKKKNEKDLKKSF